MFHFDAYDDKGLFPGSWCSGEDNDLTSHYSISTGTLGGPWVPNMKNSHSGALKALVRSK